MADLLKDGGIIVGNVYDKYHSRNWMARQLMSGFERAFDRLVEISGASRIHEVGCGEGHLSMRLAAVPGRRIRASDFSATIIEIARKTYGERVDFFVRSVYDLRPEEDSAELVVCAEVLEHLEQPHAALEALAHVASPFCLLSVPREPIWRILNMARGKYLRDFGNTPGHLQHWSTRRFRKLVARHFEIVESRTPFPWTMILARKP